MPVGYLYVFFGKNYYWDPLHIYSLDCFFFDTELQKLFILDINHLSLISFANIFSNIIVCLFVLLLSSLCKKKKKAFHLISSHLFCFISFAFRDWPKKILLWFMCQNVLSLFSFWSFMVSSMIFTGFPGGASGKEPTHQYRRR